jgi:flagella basal body P-ring formation protein FlgA
MSRAERGWRAAFGVALSLLAVPALAANQDLAALRRGVEQFVRGELSQRPASFEVGRFDPHLAVPACAGVGMSWAAGTVPANGAAYVDINCPEFGWRLRLPVTVHEKRMALLLLHAVQMGDVLGPDDVRLVEAPPSGLGSGSLDQLQQAVGQVMRTGAQGGTWLRGYMLRAAFVVKMNQRVRVVASGDGFDVRAEGTATGNGAVGDVVAVRMASGSLIRGVVQSDGSVSVAY